MWNCRVSHGPCRHLSWRFLWWGHVMVVRRNWDLAQQRRGSHRNRTAWAPQSSHIDKSYRMLAWYLHACSHVTTYMHTLLVHMHTQHLHTCTHSTYKLPCSSVSSSINGDHNNPRRRDVESEYMAMWEALRKEPHSHCAPSFVFVVVSGSLISGTWKKIPFKLKIKR